MDDLFQDDFSANHALPLDLNMSDIFLRHMSQSLATPIEGMPQIKEEDSQMDQSRYRAMVDSKEEFASNGNNKNKYINRITAIVKEGKLPQIPQKAASLIQPKGNLKSQTAIALKQEAQHMLPPNIEESSSSQPHRRDKLQKNRQSAKMSRERKKFYMELLETKVNDLEKEINKTKGELESTNNYLSKIMTQNQTMNSFALGRQQLMKRLEKLVEDGNESPVINEQLNRILDSLRARIGATGMERINTINEYFKQIINISFPALHRYMMWTASEKKHLFCQGNVEEEDEQICLQFSWFRQLDQKLSLTEEQRRQIISRREQFQDQKNVLLELIDTLHNTKKKIENKSEQLEREIDKIRNILTPMQCAKFILFIEKNKYRKELNIWDKKTASKNEQGDKTQKKLKLQ